MKINNESKDYNDTIQSQLARIGLAAFEQFDREKLNGETDRVAMARAIGDALENNLKVCSVNAYISREELKIFDKNPEYFRAVEERAFLNFAKVLFESGFYMTDRYGYPHTEYVKFQIAVLKIEPSGGAENGN